MLRFASFITAAIAVSVVACSAAPNEAATTSSASTTTKLSLLFGDLGGYGNADGSGVSARFTQPGTIVADPRGGALVGDYTLLRHVDESGFVTTLSTNRRQGSSISVDPDGNAYIVSRKTSKLVQIAAVTHAESDVAPLPIASCAGEATRDAVYCFFDSHVQRIDVHTGVATAVGPQFPDVVADIAYDRGDYTYVADDKSITRVDVTTGAATVLLQASTSQLYGGLSLSADESRLMFLGRNFGWIDLLTGTSTTLLPTPGFTSIAQTRAGQLLVTKNDDVVYAMDPTSGATTGYAGLSRNATHLDGAGAMVANGQKLVIHGHDGTLKALSLTSNALVPFGPAEQVDTIAPLDSASFLLTAQHWSPATNLFTNEVSRVDLATGVTTSLVPSTFWIGSVTGGVAFDPATKNVYLGRPLSIAKVAPSGAMTVLAYDEVMPESIVFAAPSTLYVADEQDGAIKAIDANTGAVTNLVTGMLDPGSLVLTGQTLYFCETANHVVRQLDLATKALSIVAGLPGQGGIDLATGRLNLPSGLALLPDGSLAVSSAAEDAIVRIAL